MRISDWSSDVCSSDLVSWLAGQGLMHAFPGCPSGCPDRNPDGASRSPLTVAGTAAVSVRLPARLPRSLLRPLGNRCDHARRSEEHTTELQSLMRRWSAVLCLKKKKRAQTYT